MDGITTTTKKTVYDNTKSWLFKQVTGEFAAAYIPNLNIDQQAILNELNKINFVRVMYISQYGKANRTPRLTWAYGQVNANKPNPNYNGDPNNRTVLRSMPDESVVNKPDIVNYRGLDFHSEVMPPWLEALSQQCRLLFLSNWGFDTEFNSCIIGMYTTGDDSIAFHTDDSVSYQAHNNCANVTIGEARDFQFKLTDANGNTKTHEIKLANKSVFFFNGVEHAVPPRKGVHNGTVRYSISFRTMKNNIGIGNSMYYCRGLAAAIDNDKKKVYEAKLKELQTNK